MAKMDPTAAKAQEGPAKLLDEVLELLTKTAIARGWSWTIDSRDESGHTHAAINLERSVQSGYTSQQITALCEVTMQDGVRVSMTKTSFHDYGIKQLHDAMMESLSALPWLEKRGKSTPSKAQPATTEQPPVARIERVLRRFHQVARQLKRRHSDRVTLTITDEYDVQDLLHALLRGLFDDVRAEDSTPSYAGGGARVDFLLKAEKIVIEAKMASAKLRDKVVGEQLIIDIKRYSTHPDCQKLICFVYDPEGEIKNPEGLEKDLSGKHGTIEVSVVVAPR